MGDVSIMARRLSDKYVQYGWSGNSGYFSWVGARLLDWYNDPELVEYLFGLGQMKIIGKPYAVGSDVPYFDINRPANEPCWVDRSERWIFSRIAFIDYGYFYDSDNKWYYIHPGPFRVKFPLEHIAAVVEKTEDKSEYEYLMEINKMLASYILFDYPQAHDDFNDFMEKYFTEQNTPKDYVVEDVMYAKDHIHKLFESYNPLFSYFDDWVVVVPTDNGIEFKMRKYEEPRVETINW